MPCNIYLDTSILCALADPPARSAYARTCQSLTRRWFRALPHTRNLCTSEIALAKIRNGPVALASARLHAAERFHVLGAEILFKTKSELFLSGGGLKSDAANLGSEIACAAYFGVELFATCDWWQLEAQRLPLLHLMLEQAGLSQMDFISPLQLLENDYEALLTSKGR